MPAVRAIQCGTLLAVTWPSGVTTSWDEAAVAAKAEELGRAGAAAYFQAELLAACGCTTGIEVTDYGDGFMIVVES